MKSPSAAKSAANSDDDEGLTVKQALLVFLLGTSCSVGVSLWTGHLNASHPYLVRTRQRIWMSYMMKWEYLSAIVRVRNWRWLHTHIQPFYDDPDETPYADLFASMEDNNEALTQEWDQFAESYFGAPLIANVLPDHARFNEYPGDRWSTLWLRMFGLESNVFGDDFPLLRSITKDVAFVGISVTHENTMIDVHQGYNPLILRYLFGLVVPDGCNKQQEPTAESSSTTDNNSNNNNSTAATTVNPDEKPMFLLVLAPDEEEGKEWVARYPQHHPHRVRSSRKNNNTKIDGVMAHWEQGKGILFDDIFKHGVVNLCGTRAVVWLDLPRWDLRPWGLQYIYNFIAWKIGYFLPYTRQAIRRTNECFASREHARQCNQEGGLIFKRKKE